MTVLSRRTFLRSAAGPLLPLPLLHLMQSSSRGAPNPEPPLRFMTLFKPNGVHPPSWNIAGGSEYDFRMSPLMQPFAEHRDDLLILDNMGDFGFSSHASSTRRFLSGHHENKHGASIDQLIADRIQGDTLHRSLELTTEGLFPNQIGCSYISYDAKGDPIPRESDPQLVFDRLFRSPLRNANQRREMRSVLDRVREDAQGLTRRAGVEDREILDQYLTVVREAERKLQRLQHQAPTKVAARRPEAPSNLNEQVDAMLDLVTLALWTDSTRCVTFMLGNSNSRMVFDFLGIQQQHHYLSHFFRNFSRENLDALLKISLWHMGKFDYLLKRLKSFRGPAGRLLDHTLVVYGSGMGHSDNHTVTRIPLILAGGGGRVVKTGRYVRYAENMPLARLHVSLLEKFGVEVPAYGGASQGLPGLLGTDFAPYRERPFESWVEVEGDQIIVQGRLRLSEDLNEARIFYVDLADGRAVRVDVEFRDFHRFNLAYHCGSPIKLTGQGSEQGGRLVITKVKALDSLFGKQPGTLNG